MIKYNNKIWFRHLLNFGKSDTLRMIWWEILIVGAYCGALVWVDHLFLKEHEVLQNITIVYSIVGFVLSLLLVFRTNTAYDRWWEGRKHWGSLVNNTRNLAIKLNTILPATNTEDRTIFSSLIANYVFALKEHLREGVIMDEIDDVDGIHSKLVNKKHKPNIIVQEMYRKIKSLYDAGQITGDELFLLDKELKSFTDIQGACERIRNTPIPFSYSLFLKKFIVYYVAILPIGFIAYFDWWAIPVCMFVFYVLVSLELIAEEIEDPFGNDDNDLPTQELSEKIKANVQEIFDVESAMPLPQSASQQKV